MSTPPPSSSPPAGWMPDPSGTPGVQRWWDGSSWTEHTQRGPSPAKSGAARRGCLIGCGAAAALLLVLVVLGGALSGGGSGGTGADGGTAGDDGDAQTVAVGRPLTLEGTRYQVTSARTETEIGDEFTRETPDGIFVVVEVELTNLKNDTRTISGDALKLVTRDGREYATSDDALLAVDDQIVLEDVQPNLATTGTLVFDVPTSATRGARLRVEDLFGGGEGFVRLGLR